MSVWNRPKHNAFTDMCLFKDQLFISFREATDHMGIDGGVRIISCDFSGKVINTTLIKIHNCDLRDPKLTITPDGKLLMTAYSRCYSKHGKWRYSRSLCWFSLDGLSWSGSHWFAEKNWWVWRIRWQQGQAYGLAYNRAQQQLNLYAGNPLRTFECINPNVMSLATHGLGYPNESDLCFMQNGDLYAVVRRDADSFTAQIGHAKAPYRRWRWFDLGEYIGAPVILAKDQKNVFVCGRAWLNKRFKTALWNLNLETKKLQLIDVLPSGGDCSYAGMVQHDGQLYVSYYSSHIDNQSHIYLAQLDE